MSTVEETLAWEAEWRPRAATAAILGGLLSFAGIVGYVFITSGEPDDTTGAVTVVESLRGAVTGQAPTESSLEVRQVDYLGDKVALLSLTTIASILGTLLALGALTYLFRATRARNPQVSRAVGWSIAAALALYPLGTALKDFGTWIGWSNFADASERTAGAARDIEIEGIVPAGAILQALGIFAFAIAIVLVSINAMRVGLLTRFLGILGVIIGAIVVLAFGLAPLLLLFWLTFVGLVIAGRSAGGPPPAWATGRAEPWPTQQELRERRDAVRAEHAPAPEPAADEAPAPKPHPQSKKKKKKRR
ncbi:MAG TPA: hypothetical protein VF587_01660 [Solirubrobacteraceae bacterium]